MLAKSLVEEIDRLIKQGNLSQRRIAAILRVSRGTVSAIAAGRRRLYGQISDEDGVGCHGQRTVPRRCPCCGYRVYLPCLICRCRAFNSHETNIPNRAMNGFDALSQAE
jgi:hypothetical protein